MNYTFSSNSTKDTLNFGKKLASLLKKGDMIIVTGSVPHILEEGTNFIKIHTI